MGTNRLAIGVLCVSMMLGVSSAASAQKWLKSFDVGSVHTAGDVTFGGGFGPNAGIRMGASGDSSFAASFIVPPEHTPGTPLYVGVFWHTSSATPCGIRLAPNFLSVARLGSGHIMSGGSVSTGLTPLDGSIILNATATNTPALTIYTITSPDPTRPLQAFDTINFGLFRRPTDSDDTCAAALVIQGLAVAVLN
jgi:hypothetical protein